MTSEGVEWGLSLTPYMQVCLPLVSLNKKRLERTKTCLISVLDKDESVSLEVSGAEVLGFWLHFLINHFQSSRVARQGSRNQQRRSVCIISSNT